MPQLVRVDEGLGTAPLARRLTRAVGRRISHNQGNNLEMVGKRLKRFQIITFLPLLLLLTCAKTPQQSTSVMVPQSTETATSRAPVLSVKPTDKKIIHTPTAHPPGFTKTPTPEPTSNPEVSPFPSAPMPDKDVKYQLQSPNPEELIALADLATEKLIETHQMNFFAEPEDQDPIASILSRELSKVIDFIEKDFRGYYPNGFANMNLDVVDHSVGLEHELTILIPEWTKIYVNGWAIQYIQKEHVHFEANQSLNLDGVIFSPYPIELDKDAETEWLVDVRFDRKDDKNYSYAYYTWLLLDMLPDGSFFVLPNEIPDTFRYAEWESRPYVTLDTSHDVNGDGINDVLLAESHYSAGSDFGYVYVYSWNRNSLTYIDRFYLPGINPGYGEMNESTFEVNDFDQDGLEEIKIVWPRFAEFGCTWETIITYDWDGKEFVKNILNEDIPIDTDKTECYISKALWSNAPDEKTRWFEAALNFLPKDASSDLVAWVHLRLMAAFLGQDRLEEATDVVERMGEINGNGNFLSAVLDAKVKAGPSPIDVCKEIYTQASELARNYEVFDSEIDDYISYEGYPISFEPNPSRVCPYDELPYDRLLSRYMPETADPIEEYTNAGFNFWFSEPLNIDSDPQQEWVVFYEDTLTIFDTASGRWQVDYVYDIYNVVSLQAATKDLNNDQLPEILVQVELSEPYLGLAESCPEEEKNYLLLTVDMTKEEYRRVDWYDFPCQSGLFPNISTDAGINEFLAKIQNRYESDLNMPDWYFLDDFSQKPDTDQNIDSYVQNIEEDVFSRNNLDESRTALYALLDYIPSDDPVGLALIHRMQYLIGMSYEVEGNFDEAVATYLGLIENAPNSAWSWLAWARLIPHP